MIYLIRTNVQNVAVTADICIALEKMGIPFKTLNNSVLIQGREINVNAFEQLRKRNPSNPYILELKTEIMKVSVENIESSKAILIMNKDRYEPFNKDVLFELTIAWFLKKILISFDDISISSNGELVSAMGIQSLKRDINNIKQFLEKKKEEVKIEKVVEWIKERSKRHKLIKED